MTTRDGRRLEKFVEHAVGSADHPMSDRDLEMKFSGLAEGILSPDRQHQLMDLCWKIEGLPQAGSIAQAAAA